MSLAFRAYFALPDTLATSTGVVTNAVHGFTSMLVYLIREQHPSALAVAFDAPGATFRDEILEDYKAGRAETPWLLPPQFDMIREVMAALAIPVVEAPGFEADDVIATLATEAAERQTEVVIVTGDRDSFQLVQDPYVRVLYNKRGVSDYSLYDEAGIFERCGVPPVAVRAAGLAARRPLGQPARHSGRGGEDRGQAAHQVRRPRRHLLAPGRADAEAAREPGRRTRSWPARTPASSRSCATCPSSVDVTHLDARRLGPGRRPRPPSTASR